MRIGIPLKRAGTHTLRLDHTQPLTSDIVASFPNITITMTDGATLVVQPQSYWVNLGGGYYQFGIQSGGSQFIIGDVALQVCFSSRDSVRVCACVCE